jgi:LAO/AO transport system kinase
MSLVEQVTNGNRRAIARLISQVENGQPEVQEILAGLYPHTGQAHLVGVTGPPGTGKSSLVNQLAKAYRRQELPRTVAILAVDPTSPFSGGAILGDRVRMNDLAGDPGVFIRSMASRGSMGGLARAVDDAVKVLDAAGFELIFIETVGAGQNEVEIAKTAHTVLVVEAPGLGDDVQAIKAGILEIADIFVVNKADRPGAEKTATTLKMMLELGHAFPHAMLHHGQLLSIPAQASSPSSQLSNIPKAKDSWDIPVLKTVALKGDGIDLVVAAITRHRDYLNQSGELTRRTHTRLFDELETILKTELVKQLFDKLSPEILARVTNQLLNRSLTPYAAAKTLLGHAQE